MPILLYHRCLDRVGFYYLKKQTDAERNVTSLTEKRHFSHGETALLSWRNGTSLVKKYHFSPVKVSFFKNKHATFCC